MLVLISEMRTIVFFRHNRTSNNLSVFNLHSVLCEETCNFALFSNASMLLPRKQMLITLLCIAKNATKIVRLYK